MKKSNLFLAFFGILLFAMCTSEIEVPENPLVNPNQVKFFSTIGEITTRVSATAWDPGDEIGVFALNSGQPLSASTVYDGKENIKYNTPGDGEFTAATVGITYPKEGRLDFVAYYPYNSSVSDYKYQIDVSDQSNHSAIDLLYSDNAKNASIGDNRVDLVFKHMLSQLVINVEIGDGVNNLNGLSAKVERMKVDGEMTLADGVVTTGSKEEDITPVIDNKGNQATLTSIVIPGQNLNSVKVVFKLNGKVFEWTPESQELESGKKYSYKMQLSTTGIAILNPTASIEDWEEGYTGTDDIVLVPDYEGETPSEGMELLFSGSDFEDWSAFLGALTTHGLKPGYTSQSDNGRNGSKALYLNGTPGANDFVFTVTVPEGFVAEGREVIEFYIKGTSAKSLSVNVYKAGGGFAPFNLGDYNTERVVEVAANNQYGGTIDTGGDWIKVALDISSIDLNTEVGQSLFAIKAGKDAAYDLLIDEISISAIEGGSTEPGETGELLFDGADFNDWDEFLGSLTTHGLKAGYTSESSDGRNGSNALYLNGTPSENDYVFTATVPEGFSAEGISEIQFYIKGTSAKSLSLNVYETDKDYKAFNLADYTSEKVLGIAGNNQYVGTINTGGDWVKVTLDVSSLTLNEVVGTSLFALKVGKGAVYDLLIDDITIIRSEGGSTTDPDPDPELPGDLGDLLFPGSNFNDWGAFTGNLNSYGLIGGYTSQSDNGRDSTKALYLNGTPTGNDYVFTATVSEGFSLKGRTKIIFYIKGTSAKSLSANVYVGKGTLMGTDYKCYNLGDYTAPSTILASNSNSYSGSIDTGGDWMKVTLDISGISVNSTKGDNLFAIKVGKEAAYNILIDDITIE